MMRTKYKHKVLLLGLAKKLAQGGVAIASFHLGSFFKFLGSWSSAGFKGFLNLLSYVTSKSIWIQVKKKKPCKLFVEKNRFSLLKSSTTYERFKCTFPCLTESYSLNLTPNSLAIHLLFPVYAQKDISNITGIVKIVPHKELSSPTFIIICTQKVCHMKCWRF